MPGSNYYFTKETDDAIVSFNKSSDLIEKHRLFDQKIKPAFEKLIENQIYVYGFYIIDDVDTLKRDCLASLYEMIGKYQPERGTKGFSYFNVVAKNWFIHKIREKNKSSKLESELYYDLDHEVVRNDPSFTVSPLEDSIVERERWLDFYASMESWRTELSKPAEQRVLESVIFLMRHPDLVTIYNKKAVYLYLRELTGLSTKQVVVILKKVRDLYDRWNDRFSTVGSSDESEEEL